VLLRRVVGLDRAVLFRLATSERVERAVKTRPCERLSDPGAADRVLEDYVELAGSLPPPASEVWLSLDLTHLALDTDASVAADRLATIARALSAGLRVQVGAESSGA
jgi:hypothetical protein